MAEFVNFITKGIETVEKDDSRVFSGHITAEIVDHQNEIIFVKDVMKVMDTYMSVMPVISDVHSNRMVGKCTSYEKSEINGQPSVKIWGVIFKQEGVELYDQVWNKIKTGVYQGLSMGGGSKRREPMYKNGKYVIKLMDLELYEIAVCPSPANPLAIIDKHNEFAKSEVLSKKQFEHDGRNIVQCSSVLCELSKGTNKDVDVDIDNEKIEKTDESNSSETTEDTRRKPDLHATDDTIEQFDKKPEVKKDHIPVMSESREEEAKKKNETMSKAIQAYIKSKDEIIENNEKIIKSLLEKLP